VPIDPSVAIGADVGTVDFTWTESDVLLYHLAIGAGSRRRDNTNPDALRYTVEGPSLQVLPSFGVVVPTFHMTDPPPLDLPGCDINLAQVVHGSQSVQVNGPLPTSGSATVSTRITDVWDKGKAAVIWQEGVATSEAGEELWTTRSSIFVRDEGAWGGDRGSSDPVTLPDRAPDADTTYDTSPQQALLYRLCGDRNPLHSDPDFAKAAGFPAPILHGLCSYGIVLRELTDALLSGDATQVGGFSARFSGVVYPGESIRVRGWLEDGRILASATVAGNGSNDEREGAPVLGDVVLTLA
jgi:acyl dehydratase